MNNGVTGIDPIARDVTADGVRGFEPSKITMVAPSLTCGGSERIVAGMADYWAAQKHAISVVTLSSVRSDFYHISDRVERIGMNTLRASKSLWDSLYSNHRRIKALRSIIERTGPDIVISFLPTMNVTALMAAKPLNVPVIVSERNDIASVKLHPLWRILRRTSYNRAKAVVVQTPFQKRLMAKIVDAGVNVEVIQNPIMPETRKSGKHFEFDRLPDSCAGVIVAMGRLTRQKGFDVLLEAFARAVKIRPAWQLYILGEGESRPALESQAEALGIRQQVSMPGLVANTGELLAAADLFILPSRFEGFPNALLEAMAQGAAVIASDCDSGPGEIVNHGVNGILTKSEDVDDLSEAMAMLMGDPSLRKELGSKATEVSDLYTMDRIMGEWDSLLRRTIQPTSQYRAVSRH